MSSCKVWIRVPLPVEELRSLERRFPNVQFACGEDAGDVSGIDAVFTDDPLPDEMVRRMDKLRWLHVTRGGASAYLTPAVQRRPTLLTGSKGIHGRSFSEFAVACIFTLAKKLPQCWEQRRRKEWRRVETEELEGKVAGIVFLIELEFLNGRKKLDGYDVRTLIKY